MFQSEKLHKRIEFDEEAVTKYSKLLLDWIPIFNDIGRIMALPSVTNASKNVQNDLLHAKSIRK